MKPFIRIKKINGIEYIYEITPYYDPITKTIRHKSKYLGKNVEGKPVRVRHHLPRYALLYGELLPFVSIIEELGIKDILSQYLSKTEVESLTAIVLNRVTNPVSLMHIGSWYEGTYLCEKSTSSLSSQSISRLLHKIGSSALPERFSECFIGRMESKSTLIYDITSVSSYSKLIEILEYGYSRDRDGLPQVNLSLIVDQKEGIPIGYDIYPGSIVDVTTLKRTVERLKSYGVSDCLLVLDRGFFSIGNIEELNRKGLSYIIAASGVNKEVKSAMAKARVKLKDPNLMKLYNGVPIFVTDVKIKIGSESVNGYCYFIPSRQNVEEESFYKRLYEVKEALEKLEPKQRGIKERIEEIAGAYKNYLSISVSGAGLKVKIRKNAVSQRLNRMGMFVLLYRGQISWQECLSIYRSKDIVEKGFEILKNDLEVRTPQVKKESTLRGLLFVCFIGLILRMRLSKKMDEAGLSKRYSVEGLLLELSKLKVIEMTDGKRIKTELTKKQKEIISLLNLCA